MNLAFLVDHTGYITAADHMDFHKLDNLVRHILVSKEIIVRNHKLAIIRKLQLAVIEHTIIATIITHNPILLVRMGFLMPDLNQHVDGMIHYFSDLVCQSRN